MNVSIYQAAAALQANNRWQEMIGENLSSSSLSGFKKQDVSFSAVAAGLIPQAAAAPNGVTTFDLPRATGTVTVAPGELNVTGEATDLALEGAGFFEVQMPDGTNVYTRNGGFAVSIEGELINKAGSKVMSDRGPIQIDPKNPAPLVISADGEVRQGTDVKGKIKVVDFNDPKLLSITGGSYFLANDPKLAMFEVEEPTVRQGFLEASNTSAVLEMSNLITAMRMYEANQRVVQAHDERMTKAIHELGSPS